VTIAPASPMYVGKIKIEIERRERGGEKQGREEEK
jgi:hypothetical protein